MPRDGLPHSRSLTISDVAGSHLLPNALRHRWWLYFVAINSVLVLATFYVGAGYPHEFFLRPLALSTEQGVGTWWSGFQFLIFTLMARSLAVDLQATSPKTSRGLVLLSLVGLLLFIDEMASVHERLGILLPLPGQLHLLPLAIGGGVLLFWGLFLLRQERHVTSNAPWMIFAAFGLFGCVFLLELGEHRLTWEMALLRGLRFAIEEGLELAGGLLLIASMVHVQQSIDPGHRRDLVALLPTPRALLWLCRLCAYAAIPVWLLRSAFTADQLTLPTRGDFGVLIPIVWLICAALLAVRPALTESNYRFRWWLLAGVLMLASLDLECHFHHYLLYGSVDLRWRPDLGLLWSTPLLFGAMLAVPGLRTRTALVGLAASYLLVVISALLGIAPLALATPYMVAFLMLQVVAKHVVGRAPR